MLSTIKPITGKILPNHISKIHQHLKKKMSGPNSQRRSTTHIGFTLELKSQSVYLKSLLSYRPKGLLPNRKIPRKTFTG